MFDLYPLETEAWYVLLDSFLMENRIQGVDGEGLRVCKANQSVNVEESASRDTSQLRNHLQRAVARAKQILKGDNTNNVLRQLHSKWMDHAQVPMTLPARHDVMNSPSKLTRKGRFDYMKKDNGTALDLVLGGPEMEIMFNIIVMNLANGLYDGNPEQYHRDMSLLLEKSSLITGNAKVKELFGTFQSLSSFKPLAKQHSDEATLYPTPTSANAPEVPVKQVKQEKEKKLAPGQHHTQLKSYSGPRMPQGDSLKGNYTGWICPVDGCKEHGAPCRVRGVEMRQGSDDAMPRLYYTDGTKERVYDHDCGLVQHMLAHHKDRMASKQERAKRRRAEGVLWHCTCKNRINKNDGVVEVGHFLSAKHHGTRHYQCNMKVHLFIMKS